MSLQQPQPLEALRDFQVPVSSFRSTYISSLQRLPPSISTTAIAHLQDRVSRADPRPMLGEFVPAMIADILNIPHTSADLSAVVNGWLHLYYAIMMLDDAIDRRDGRFGEREVLTSAFLLERGLNQLLGTVDGDRQQFVDGILSRTVEAAIDELNRRHTPSPEFTAMDLQSVTGKLAMLHVCVDAVAAVAPKGKRIDWLFDATEFLATGFQLLDDLTDWEEDLNAGHMTLPLTLAFANSNWRGLECYDDAAQNVSLFQLTLVCTRSFQKTLIRAVDALTMSLTTIREHTTTSSLTTTFLASVIDTSAQASRELDCVRDELCQLLSVTSDTEYTPKLFRRLSTTELHLFGNKVTQVLEVVAQGS